jgi:hypothetical protein
MPDPLPIVFIHLFKSEYLPFTLGQAKMKNLNSPVIIIGDDSNNIFPFATHLHMNRYCKQAVEFQKIYKHFSPNGFIYEQFCFLRWFLLRDFMRAHSIQRLIHLDSDVLIYVDVNQEQKNWQHAELSLINGDCAGNMFVNGAAALEELCQSIWDMYASPGAEQRLAALSEQRHSTGRLAVSDMVPLRAFYDANRHRVAEMTGIQYDGSYWDANVHLDEGFETESGRKRYRFDNGRPYCRHVATSRDIFFKSLHFQGIAKSHIEPAFRAGLQSTTAPATQAA